LRLYPHDDNQGGFFCAVFEKTEPIGRGGTALDKDFTKDAWEDKSVRQKPMVDELMQFATWYEKQLEASYEAKGTPQEERENVGLVKMLEETKNKEKEADEAAGFNCQNLSEQRKIYQRKQENEKFPYANLMEIQPETPRDLATFYGINEEFPWDNLYFRHDTVK